jgi:hypothetical protein
VKIFIKDLREISFFGRSQKRFGSWAGIKSISKCESLKVLKNAENHYARKAPIIDRAWAFFK